MKVLAINRKDGYLFVMAENPDDLWALSIIIKPGDQVVKQTTRKLKLMIGDRTEAERKPMTLRIKVEGVEFHGFTADLRVSGQILEGPEGVKGGHTFTISPHSKLKIYKQLGPEDMELLKEHKTRQPKVAVVLVDREGALVAFKQKKQFLPAHLGSKKGDGAAENKFKQFFGQVKRAVSLLEPEFVVVAGPGFVKDKLAPYLSEAGFKVTKDSASSVSEGGVREVYNRGTIQQVAGQVREAREEQLVEEVFQSISQGGKAFYGIKEAREMVNQDNVEKLVVASSLVGDLASKHQYSQLRDLMQKVKYAGGEVHLIGINEAAEQRLEGLGGIAGIKRW